jgi:hypothetical protein
MQFFLESETKISPFSATATSLGTRAPGKGTRLTILAVEMSISASPVRSTA